MELHEALRDAVGSMTLVESLAGPYENAGIDELIKGLAESDMPEDDKSLGWAMTLYKMAGGAIVGSLVETSMDKADVARFVECINYNMDNLATAYSDVFGDSGLFPFPVADS